MIFLYAADIIIIIIIIIIIVCGGGRFHDREDRADIFQKDMEKRIWREIRFILYAEPNIRK